MISDIFRSIEQGIRRELRKHFFLKSVIATISIALFIQFPPVGEIPDAKPSTALLEISHSIWHQVDYPAGTHLEKKTLRPFVPFMIRVLGLVKVEQIYGLMFLTNIGVLALFIALLNLTTGDRLFSFFIGAGFGCVYCGCIGFLDTKGWTDIIPIFLVGLAMVIKNSWLIAPILFAALASDERCLLSLPFVWLWYIFRAGGYEEFRFNQGITATLRLSIAMVIGVLCFLALRLYMNYGLGFENKFGLVGTQMIWAANPGNLYLGLWSPFEAFWIFPVLLIHGMIVRKKAVFAYLLCGAILAGIFFCYMVQDITRSLSYLFPIFPLSIVFFFRTREDKNSVLDLAMLVGLICLLCPTQNVFSSVQTYSPIVFHVSHLRHIF